ncbi:MAG TPA: C40 family peptidase [Pseudolabrys sp.]|nr:C40 family peptidase [Pseudolabrys sp.]
MGTLDPRLNAFRPDLAASHLRGKVEAARFVDGTACSVLDAQAPLRREPSPDAALDTEALYGETVAVYETNDEGWVWAQLVADGYVGWLPANALGRPGPAATHKVAALRTLAFVRPDIKTPPVSTLPFGARVSVAKEDAAFAVTTAGWFLPRRHLMALDASESDFVAVAERFVGTPYLWGGKSNLGIDCSGLVQVSLQAAGIACPRDSDMQAALGTTVALDALRRGDLIFWKGHVAIARDATSIVHANAFQMAVAIEAVAEAIARIKAGGSEVASVRRLPA